MQVMAAAGDRILDGAESAEQRLGDALRIARGSYPMLRTYGSRVADEIDRSLDGSGIAELSAAAAEAILVAANGLDDCRLRRVRAVADGDGAVVIEVDALWSPPIGEAVPISIRQQLAAAPSSAGTPSDVLTWRGEPLTWRGESLTWR